MASLFLLNSLSRRKEKFLPLKEGKAGVYSCGPTVYDYASIGNFRTYTLTDTLVRTLKFQDFDVVFVMNITDVGHLTGDNLGDADLGEDRIEKAARKERRTAWDIANFYTEAFLRDYEKLNLTPPDKLVKATDHIKEQIELIKKLEEKGFTYRISDGIYFDTVVFERKTGEKYGKLSTMDVLKEGARVETNPEKKNPRDFALWKFSSKNEKRQMEWNSPWGVGFPGWHIECSAMSMKYLGETFDIHVGGEDLRQIHHPNEIAQAEAATGKPFVKYWLHVTFLTVNGEKMSKSLGNVFTVSDIEEKGFDPLALKYLYLTAHYRDTLNFTWEALSASQKALDNLRGQLLSFKSENQRTMLSLEKSAKVEIYRNRFLAEINNDLNTPKALAVLWEMIKSNIPSYDKYELAIYFDEILGLKLAEIVQFEIPQEIQELVDEREILRKEGNFEKADEIRKKIEEKGFKVEDTSKGARIKKKR